LRNEDTRPGWAIVIIFTAVSTFFNMAHSPEGLLARISHGIPPIALMCSLEVCMMILKSDLNRTTDISLESSKEKADVAQYERMLMILKSDMNRQGETMNHSNDTLTPTPDTIMSHLITHPNDTIAQVCRDLNISKSTVIRYKKKMNQSVQGTG